MSEEVQAPATRAWVLHPEIRAAVARHSAQNALAETVALVRALPALEVAGASVVRLAKARPGLLFGRGKIAELGTAFADAEVGLVVIDGALTPVQQRNLEKAWEVKILDRTGLILEIFSNRARTREGVLQVEMAALTYQRTRLVRAWTHLERQRGGLGFVGGPGETQVEADRRAIDTAITRLRRQLAKVVKTRALHRAARQKVPFPVVALVGYTNSGKSTLFNRLTGASVLARDMLFATLDPTMRVCELASGQQVILSDTVGFISDLPTELVAAFRATLEEVLDADLIVHVRDISHPETAEQAQDVDEILTALGVAQDAPRLEVWNKIDVLSDEGRARVIAQAARSDAAFAISALTGVGMAALGAAMSQALTPRRFEADLLVPFSQGKRRAWLYEAGVVQSERQLEDGFALRVLWSARQQRRFDRL